MAEVMQMLREDGVSQKSELFLMACDLFQKRGAVNSTSTSMTKIVSLTSAGPGKMVEMPAASSGPMSSPVF
jgi:hypothetical protein